MRVYLQRRGSLSKESNLASIKVGQDGMICSMKGIEDLGRDCSAVAIGNFDGLHVGHRALLRQTLKLAREMDGRALVLTFDPPPLRVIAPERAPPLIDSPRQKLESIASLGIDAVVVLSFDRDLAAMSPRSFAAEILADRIGARYVVVGEGFYFGEGRRGDYAELERLGERYGFSVVSIDPLRCRGQLISSSMLRRAIADGDVQLAARLRQMNVRLAGRVARGRGRGRELGFPTANLAVENELIPASGVYVGRATLPDGPPEASQSLPTVINIGRAPTLCRGRELEVEAHLLDFVDIDLVNRELELSIYQRVRDERMFSSTEELKTQIAEDIKVGRTILRASD